MSLPSCHSIPYELVRSPRRKTLAIQVKGNGEVRVLAPERLAMRHIAQFIQKKDHWIRQKQAEANARLVVPEQHEFIEGEAFRYRGHIYPLQIRYGVECDEVFIDGEQLVVAFKTTKRVTENRIKNGLQQWYQEQTLQVVQQHCDEYAKQLGVRYGKIKLGRYKRKWGSCNQKGDLTFHWLLIMAPMPVLEYVVVHEVCHLQHLNHSKAFWAAVAELMPHYQDSVSWLKKHGRQLYF